MDCLDIYTRTEVDEDNADVTWYYFGDEVVGFSDSNGYRSLND